MSRLARDGTAEPVLRTKSSGADMDREMLFFPLQLTTSRIGNLTRLTIHTYIYTYIHTCIHIYIRMYGHHIWQSMDQPGKVANPARGQLNREN